MKLGRPKGQRGVDPANPASNRFRRLVTLCGLSVDEAADYVEITRVSVQQKMAGARGIRVEEERTLASLWRRIRSGQVDRTDPGGAQHRAIAIREAAAISAGEDVETVKPAWDRMQDEADHT